MHISCSLLVFHAIATSHVPTSASTALCYPPHKNSGKWSRDRACGSIRTLSCSPPHLQHWAEGLTHGRNTTVSPTNESLSRNCPCTWREYHQHRFLVVYTANEPIPKSDHRHWRSREVGKLGAERLEEGKATSFFKATFLYKTN